MRTIYSVGETKANGDRHTASVKESYSGYGEHFHVFTSLNGKETQRSKFIIEDKREAIAIADELLRESLK